MTTETESVNEVLAEMHRKHREMDSMHDGDYLHYFATRIQAAHAREVGELQAEIDRLMHEHCPLEMTLSQVDRWAASQRVTKPRVEVIR